MGKQEEKKLAGRNGSAFGFVLAKAAYSEARKGDPTWHAGSMCAGHHIGLEEGWIRSLLGMGMGMGMGKGIGMTMGLGLGP